MIEEAEAEGEAEGEGEGEEQRDGRKTYKSEDETFESELSTQDWRELGIACECTG